MPVQKNADAKRVVLSCFFKTASDGAVVIVAGRRFHCVGPATANERSPILVLERGTSSNNLLTERSRMVLVVAAVGRMKSDRYKSAVSPYRHLQTMTAILN